MSRRIEEFRTFNVESSTKEDFLAFIEYLRQQLGVRFSHKHPVLAVQENPPTQFFDLVLDTNTHAVRFRFRSDNLYLLGYRMANGQWLEFNPDPKKQKNQRNKRNGNNQGNQNNQLVHVITEPQTNFLGFRGSYPALAGAADLRIEDMRVGFHNLVYAINQLAETTDRQARAQSLVVVIMMICESTRLIPVSRYMADNFNNRPDTSRATEGLIKPWILPVVRSWGQMCVTLLRADTHPGGTFRLHDDITQIPRAYGSDATTAIAQAEAVLGILLDFEFKPTGQNARSLTKDKAIRAL